MNVTRSPSSPVVDGLSDSKGIADLFSSKFADVLNTHSSVTHDTFRSLVSSSVNSSHLSEISFSDEDVLEAISQLKPRKSDCDGICSEHLKYASSALAKPLAILFNMDICHSVFETVF